MNKKSDTNKPITSIVKVAFSNIIKLLSGILVAFLLPKVVGVTDYGYYKTFTLYASYVALLAIGITDGIYLKYGGVPYEELDKSKFSFYSKFYIALQIILSILPAIFILFFLEGDMQFLFVALAVYTIFSNVTGYYQIISQITCRFTELSRRNLIQSILMSVFIFILWITHRFFGVDYDYKIFIIGFVTIIGMLSLWYLYTYREITFTKCSKDEKKYKEILDFIKIGIPLLICNLSSTFIFSLDRQFVQLLFSIEEYAIYAFAYNMLTLITTATSAISVVLYPVMKRDTIESVARNYHSLISSVLVFIFACLICYFPLTKIVEWLLTDYVDSLPIFRIILPGLATSTCITIIMHNYFKVTGKNNLFLAITLLVLAISCGANYIAYYFFGTPNSISWASIIVMFVWYLICDLYFYKKYNTKLVKNITYLILMTILFYFISMINVWWLGMVVYFFAFLLIVLLFYYKEIKILVLKFRKKRKTKQNI